MFRIGLPLLWTVVGLLSVAGVSAVADPPQPLERAHAHNDYLHARPLHDALSYGFCSIEADVFLVEGALWIGHDPTQLTRERTLESMYLAPLAERIAANQGRVYLAGPRITLLVDFKTEAEATFTALETLLRKYESMLYREVDGQAIDGAIQVIISGNRPEERIATSRQRLAFMDGRLPDLDDPSSRTWMPLISDHWPSHFSWNGEGEMNSAERDKLVTLVRRAHEQGRRLRFWATPDQVAMWQVLNDAEVDLINTDRLRDLSHYLQGLR